MTSIRKITATAILIAMCTILPMAFHLIGAGSTFAPMHIPVLLCGLICGGWYGLACGVIGPVISSILTGMPAPTILVSMIPELITYGVITGLLMRVVRTGKFTADLYVSMVVAMLAGRIVGGIAKALFYLGTGSAYSLGLWASGYFVTSLPGIIVHLVLVPVLMLALKRAKLIPERYPA